jgi:hypothetical protein
MPPHVKPLTINGYKSSTPSDAPPYFEVGHLHRCQKKSPAKTLEQDERETKMAVDTIGRGGSLLVRTTRTWTYG